MLLSPADRARIIEAYRERIGNTSLPTHITIDTICANLVLAIPALLDTIDATVASERALILERDAAEQARHAAVDRHQADILRFTAKIRQLTEQLEKP